MTVVGQLVANALRDPIPAIMHPKTNVGTLLDKRAEVTSLFHGQVTMTTTTRLEVTTIGERAAMKMVGQRYHCRPKYMPFL